MKFVCEIMFHFHLEIVWLGHIELFIQYLEKISTSFLF